MMRRVAVTDATRALRCPGWHEIHVDERTDISLLRWRLRVSSYRTAVRMLVDHVPRAWSHTWPMAYGAP
eukprot:2007515-Prymnesium_polylepis.1